MTEDLQRRPEPMPSGAAAAALLAAALGSATLGVVVPLSEAAPGVKAALALSAGVGPLSGKVAAATLVWALLWIVLHVRWRAREVNLSRVLRWTWILIGIAFLGTFPPFYELFTTH